MQVLTIARLTNYPYTAVIAATTDATHMYDLCISLGLFTWSTSHLPCVLLRAEDVQCWLIWTHDTFNINTLWAKLCSSGAGLQGSAVHLVTVLGCWIHNRYISLTITRSVSVCLHVLYQLLLSRACYWEHRKCRVEGSILKYFKGVTYDKAASSNTGGQAIGPFCRGSFWTGSALVHGNM